MPELPDVTLYVERLQALFGGQRLKAVRISSPFLLRSVEPPVSAVHGKRLLHTRRMGKRIVLGFEEELFLVIHLMVAGRLRMRKPGVAVPRKGGLAAFDFPDKSILFTEASKKKRASLHVVRGEAGLEEHGRGGYEVLEGNFEGFREALLRENRTLKRALTDPRILSGIGNAYSDELLHRARLSPVKLTSRLEEEEVRRLHAATVHVLESWTERLRQEVGDGFPEKVTAFHDQMAVHGKYREPCPDCGAPIQRIRYADNEANYCARCQNADRLLKKDWPRTLDELEARRSSARSPARTPRDP